MLHIENFKIEDLKEVIKIEKDSFPLKIAFSEKQFLSYYYQFPEKFLVAKRGKEILGYVIGKMRNQKGEIVSLAVKRGWRRRGIGKKLIGELVRRFKKEKAKEVFLHVREKNEPAISLYKKLGFKILKKIENYYSNGDSAFLMKKCLRAGSSGD